MPKLILDGVSSTLDGEYDFKLTDGEELTLREGMQITQICGLTVPALVVGVLSENDGARAALAAVVLGRHDKPLNLEELLDAPRSSVRYDWSDVLDDSDHPTQPSGDESEPGSHDGDNAEPTASGAGSKRPSGSRAGGRKVTGARG